MDDAPHMIRSSRFRAEREATWRELEALVVKIDRRGLKTLDREELHRLPVLYRATLSSLSVARSISLDRNLLEYLEQLCARAYFCVYGTRINPIVAVANFFARTAPRTIRELRHEILVSALLMFGAALLGYLLTSNDMDWFYGLASMSAGDARTPAAATAELRETLYREVDAKESLKVFATFLFTHNSAVSFLAFALGFVFGVPTAVLLFYNGLSIGAFVALFDQRGLGVDVLAWLAIHGTTELFAIVLAGGAGLALARAMLFPGRDERTEALKQAGAKAGTVMVLVVCMLFVAAGLEGFGRQLVNDIGTRFAIGGAMLVLWLLYFTVAGRPRYAGDELADD